jgi:hypothetical protein
LQNLLCYCDFDNSLDTLEFWCYVFK